MRRSGAPEFPPQQPRSLRPSPHHRNQHQEDAQSSNHSHVPSMPTQNGSQSSTNAKFRPIQHSYPYTVTPGYKGNPSRANVTVRLENIGDPASGLSNKINEGSETLLHGKSMSTSAKSPRRDRGNTVWARLRWESWTLELLSWALATCCIIAIIIVFVLYDNQPASKWPLPVTLNALLQTLLTLAGMSLGLPVTEALSQSKWIYFKNRDRRVDELDDFDEASRGLIGSVKFLGSIRFRSRLLPSLGALILITTLAVGPISQQSLQFVQNLVPLEDESAATSPRSTMYRATDPNSGAPEGVGTTDIELSMEAALYAGILTKPSVDLAHVEPRCSTGNCTWPDYKTIGICSSVADVTERITVLNVTDNGAMTQHVSLPSGPTMRTYDELAETILFWSASKMSHHLKADQADECLGPECNYQSQVFQNVLNNSVADFFIMWKDTDSSNTDNLTYRAAEVNLQYCVQTLRTFVRNGTSQTTVLEEYLNFEADNPLGFGSVLADFGNWTAKLPGPEKYQIGREVYLSFPYQLALLFNGTYTRYTYLGNPALSPSSKAILNVIKGPPYRIAAIEVWSRNLARSLTNNMRSAATAPPAIGQAFIETTYVHISYQWLTLLFILDLLSLFFLLATIFVNRRAKLQLWKSSSTALLVALQTKDRPTELDGLNRPSEIHGQMRDKGLTLTKEGDNQWRLNCKSMSLSMNDDKSRVRSRPGVR